MIVLNVRNVHDALPRALEILRRVGVHRDSRNGPVVMSPEPVATVYEKPLENVIFWPERDANPFFHLYEALWMLAGRNDVAGPARYTKQMLEYSDDGVTFHGAYGYRWRKWIGTDQLRIAVRRLIENRDDRRVVLQMWSAGSDLDRNGKDVPCNLTATFQVSHDGKLDLVVFNRSNDVIWGCYGANAVHFSFLLEYVATQCGYPVGTYTQVSVNWHAYDNEQFKKVQAIRGYDNPYCNRVSHVPMPSTKYIDSLISILLRDADTSYEFERLPGGDNWSSMIETMLKAHQVYRASKNVDAARNVLGTYTDQAADWIAAGHEWLERRRK